MSARSFRSVGWVAGVAATALGCYMVNLKVASERAALEDVETRIVLAERDIRLLQTEIGTRGRLAQLEKWNVKVLALSAPAANQFMDGSFQLATLVAPQKVLDPTAPVVLASAPAPAHQPVLASDGAVASPSAQSSPAGMLHTASLKRELPAAAMPRRVAPAPKPVPEKSKLAQAAAERPTPARRKVAPKVDPLAPKPEAKATAPAKTGAAASKPKAVALTKPKAKVETKTAAAKPKREAESEAAAKPKREAATKTAATSKPKSKEAPAKR